jgi:hypothetical protein
MEGQSGPFFRPETGLCLVEMAMNPSVETLGYFQEAIRVRTPE